ncbi:helix-turn-helix domain-containing protein [Cellulophaga sp. F20128]|uniref:hybrid sensor histidine kinase/response regulator transcription factor n=1 Tax=Cellulophaga sp. F20128 TaxID=2926413 RepID=UPI001FF55C84|nr:hybrid sensor histidine kinase/response regulator transcription factor [Cellulophaga sp. F20128]MCK0158560.1 helix-turn-helix domain-containing protein [Cellulophaga sp. F20128]
MVSSYCKIIYHTLLFCFIVLSSFLAKAQESANEKPFSFNRLTINDGLSQNSVISIAQDSIGHLWLATQDGLNKYNGKSFTYYDKQFEDITRPTFSKLGKIYVDKEKQLWIISSSGKLERYHLKSDTFLPIKTFNNVSTIFQDSNLNMYVGTYDNGLYRIDATSKDTLQLFRAKDKEKTVYDFIETNSSLIVVTSSSIFEFDHTHSYNPLRITNRNNANFSTLERDKNNTIWLGTFGKGLYYKPENESSFVKYQHDGLPEDLSIQDLLIDKNNRLWIATYGNGAYVVDLQNNTLANYKADKNNPFALQYNDLLCLYEDVTGIIWLGSDGAGANYFDTHLIKFNVITNNQIPKNVNVDVVRSISTDHTNNLWIGTSGKGLTRINFKTNDFKTFTTKNSSLSSNRIISLLHNTNKLWIGHQGFGLNILDNSGNFQTFSEISDLTIWRIIKENDHQSWLCTEQNGVILFDLAKGVIKQYNTNNSSLQTNDIKTLTKGEKDILWLGTEDNGLYKLNTKTDAVTKIETINEKIKSLYYNNHILWIGTNGKGLEKYNTTNNSIQIFTKAHGLPNNVIYGILPGNQEDLWLSTNFGISKFSPQNNHVENYSKYDGLQAPEFNTGAYHKDSHGNLYFGGLEGLNWFNPNQLTFNPIAPKTIITNFEVYATEQPLIPNKAFKFNENTVTFTFSSLHYSQPARNQYKYQLVNYNSNWVDAGNTNRVRYTNLPPSDYTFNVISSNYDGVWNNTPATYSFTIKQPWYLSTVAIIAYVLLFLTSISLIYTYLKWRWHMKMQLQYELKEVERLKQLDAFKTNFYTNVSHEFKTPLTLIKGPLENQLKNPKISNEDRNELALAQRNSNRLLNLVNQLLDLSLLETGNLNLSIKKDNLNVLLKQLLTAFKYKSEEKNITFSFKIQQMTEAWYDKDVMEKIVTNLLSNAVKYTPENGKIHFESTVKQGQIIITILNNGCVLSNDKIGKLFQRYYRDETTKEGSGIGLSLVKELTILNHGTIVAHKMNDDDIQFIVTLPIERSYFNASEILEDSLIMQDVDEVVTTENETTNNGQLPVLLIVEDDKELRYFIKSIFKSHYQIHEAINGAQGIIKAKKIIPNLIISDIMMPITDGIALCNSLKHNELTSHIPIILLTAKSGNKNEITGLKTGADAYLTKPFSTEKLKLQVRKLIESRELLRKHFSKDFTINPHFETSTTEVQFLNRLKTVMDGNIINSTFTSEEFATEMHMSRTQLHRKLKAIVGMSSSEFIRTQRLLLATQWLEKSDASISEIAYAVGFNTPSYFIKCFKETYKCTPAEYLLQ